MLRQGRGVRWWTARPYSPARRRGAKRIAGQHTIVGRGLRATWYAHRPHGIEPHPTRRAPMHRPRPRYAARTGGCRAGRHPQ